MRFEFNFIIITRNSSCTVHYREMQEKFRSFSQFHTASEHEQFLRNLTKERSLRLRIRELIKYRRNGLTQHEECTKYERERYFRERRKEARLERQRRKSVSIFPNLPCCLNGFDKPQWNWFSSIFHEIKISSCVCWSRFDWIFLPGLPSFFISKYTITIKSDN